MEAALRVTAAPVEASVGAFTEAVETAVDAIAPPVEAVRQCVLAGYVQVRIPVPSTGYYV